MTMSRPSRQKPPPLRDRQAMTHWVRFRHRDAIGFGTLTRSEINVHDGELFGQSQPSGCRLALSDVQLLPPAEPSQINALWNNSHALPSNLNVTEPHDPLSLLKAPPPC